MQKKYIRSAASGMIFILLALLSLAACSGQDPGLETPAATMPVQVEASPTPLVMPDTPVPAAHTPTQPAAGQPAPVETDQVEAAAPVPDCSAPAALTPSMTEGPFYTAGSPERTSLLDEEMAGTRLILTGYVLDTDCQPIANAWLDFWQTDDQGQYDNAGYRMRGHQFTDDAGRYRLETIVPGEYPGRTAHIHLKVQAPGGPVLTSQLFFPGVPGNQTDSIFSPQLLVDMQETQEGVQATYNFVVDTG